MEVIKSLCDATDTKFGSRLIETSPKVKKGKFNGFAVAGSEMSDCSRGIKGQQNFSTTAAVASITGVLSYLSLSRLQTSPPRQASSSMYTYLLSLNVRYSLVEEKHRRVHLQSQTQHLLFVLFV